MIKIICVGKIKEKFYKEAIEEYQKRLTKYTKIEIIEVKDEANTEKALKIEGERILSKINQNDYIITLDINGKPLTSLELASTLDKWLMQKSTIVFIIGGSYGLSTEVKKRSNYSLSFSNLTFPHQLFRVILLEQIYRSFKINFNESYHKWIKIKKSAHH